MHLEERPGAGGAVICFQLPGSPQPFRGDRRMLEQVLIPDCTEMFCCLESGLKMFEFLLHFWVCVW